MPSMMAFDAQTREKCVVERPRTNTPLQALVTMNDEQFVEAARKLAERILTSPASCDEDRIHYAFQLATSRPADKVRLQAIQNLINSMKQEFSQDIESAEALLKMGESKPDETLKTIELASWTMAASAILNLDETLTKE